MNDFDNIINDLDGWLDRKPTGAPQAQEGRTTPPKNPGPPVFNVGDLVVMQETRWMGKVHNFTGLYSVPGFPDFGTGDIADKLMMPGFETDEKLAATSRTLRENIAGSVKIGEHAKVLASCYHEPDGRWYYFLDSVVANKTGQGARGWTRCDMRFKKV